MTIVSEFTMFGNQKLPISGRSDFTNLQEPPVRMQLIFGTKKATWPLWEELQFRRRLFWCDRTWPNRSKVWTFKIIKSVLFQGLIHQKKSTWAPYEQAKTVSRTFSFSRRYLIAKFENRISTRTRNFFYRFGRFHNFKLLLLGLLNTQVPFPTDCSFKICEKPWKFSKSVRVVLSVSEWMTLTLCQRLCGPQFLKISNYIFITFLLVFYFFPCVNYYRWLCWHNVRVPVVLDYADTCQCSPRLCWTGACLHSRWLRCHGVSVCVHYADTRFHEYLCKTKDFANCFSLFIWSPGGVFWFKKCRKSRNTVPLNGWIDLTHPWHLIYPSQSQFENFSRASVPLT